MKYYLSFKCCKDCLSNETKIIFPVMIFFCYFYTLPNLSVTELTNNILKTSVFH